MLLSCCFLLTYNLGENKCCNGILSILHWYLYQIWASPQVKHLTAFLNLYCFYLCSFFSFLFCDRIPLSFGELILCGHVSLITLHETQRKNMTQPWPKFRHVLGRCDWFRNKYNTQARPRRTFPGTILLGLSEKTYPVGVDRLVGYEVGLWQAI